MGFRARCCINIERHQCCRRDREASGLTIPVIRVEEWDMGWMVRKGTGGELAGICWAMLSQMRGLRRDGAFPDDQSRRPHGAERSMSQICDGCLTWPKARYCADKVMRRLAPGISISVPYRDGTRWVIWWMSECAWWGYGGRGLTCGMGRAARAGWGGGRVCGGIGGVAPWLMADGGMAIAVRARVGRVFESGCASMRAVVICMDWWGVGHVQQV